VDGFYTERYIGLGVSIGVKIFTLLLLVSTGMGLSDIWLSMAKQMADQPSIALDLALAVLGASIAFAVLCWRVPKLFASVLGGSPSLSAGDMIGATVTAATGAVAAGALVTSGVGAVSAVAGGSAVTRTSAAAADSDLFSMIASVSSKSGGYVPPPPLESSPRNWSSNGSVSGAAVDPPARSGSTAERWSTGFKTHGTNTRMVDPPSLGGEPLAGSGSEAETASSAFRQRNAFQNTSAHLKNAQRALQRVQIDTNHRHVHPPQMPLQHEE
jgi:type IV secretion system protein TrbL